MANIDLVEIGGNKITHTIRHGQKTVTTAGTDEVLGTTQAVSAVTIKALAANTGKIYVGANPVTSSTGYELSAGEAVLVMTNDLANIYIDASVNGEGVSWIAS